MDAAQVADVHDVAPRFGDAQPGPLVCGERLPRLRDDDRREYDKADRVDPGILRGLVLAPLGKAARLKLLLTVSSCYFGCLVLLRSPCIPLENRNSLFHSPPLGFTKRSRPVGALFTAHQHEIKPGLDFCSLLTFNDGAARRQDFELCWSRFV